MFYNIEELTEKAIRKTVSFTIASKKLKWVDINLRKQRVVQWKLHKSEKGN